MRIGIANDVRIAAEIIRRVISKAGRHEVAWVAEDGDDAVRKCVADTPDLVLMDLVMPRMDGVEATRRIMEEKPCPILVVTASVEANAAMVFDALGHGALDAVATPVMGGSGTSASAQGLVDKIAEIEASLGDRASSPGSESPPAGTRRAGRNHIVCVGVSSSGPKALAAILGDLDPAFPAPIVVIQHLDTDFAKGLHTWLRKQTRLDVRVARAGDAPAAGAVLVPASVEHLAMGADGRLEHVAAARATAYRPSIDVFFKSVAYRWKGTGTGILLQGMGIDGAEGLLALREKGFHTVAQAAPGMPRAAIESGAAAEVLSIDGIRAALLALQGA